MTFSSLYIHVQHPNYVGCHIGHTCMACLMYVDDILLISASLAGLQELLNGRVLTSNEICLKFNEKKSQCIINGLHQHTHCKCCAGWNAFNVGK